MCCVLQEEEQAVPFCNTNAALENYIYLKVISIHSGHDVERDLFENLSQLLLGYLRSSLPDDGLVGLEDYYGNHSKYHHR